MKLKEYNLDQYEQRSIPSLGLCIYCGLSIAPDGLTDEHIIPFALGHNTLIFKKASCKPCAEIIQRYEQEVLKKQLGNFRLQVDAPSRTKTKDRPTTLDIPFIEVDGTGKMIRNLGTRPFTLEEAPLVLNLWSLPEARIMRGDAAPGDDMGRPWSFAEERAEDICRKVAEETDATNVAMKTGEVNRNHFLRFLAKTAHAYAVAELGMDGFKPFLNEIILNKCDDVSMYVGGTFPVDGNGVDPAETVRILIGGTEEFVAVLCQFYPSLRSPAYAVVVGQRHENTDQRIKAMEQHYI